MDKLEKIYGIYPLKLTHATWLDVTQRSIYILRGEQPHPSMWS